MKTLFSVVALMAAFNFSNAQSVMKEADSNKDVLRPTYHPPASISNSSRLNQERPASFSQTWWPGFYRSLQNSVSSGTSATDKKNSINNK